MNFDAFQSPVQAPPVWGVGALLRAMADALAARFNPVAVRGEITGFARAASGHCYFSVKDESGQLRCAMFRRAAVATGQDLRNGLLVELRGKLDVYGPRGDLQLIVESARPAGQGSLYEQFLRLKAELESQGYFDPSRKRPLPAWPRGIAVVTSLDAAALRDVASVLQRRVPHLPVRVFAAPVQGEQAPAALCQALDQAYGQHGSAQLDVLLLVRGGGSIEDLWAFNSPALVRKIAEAPMPVVCGVGHETDFTLADFVADLRAATPTAAAELCAPSRQQLLERLQALADTLGQGARRALDVRAQRLDRLAQRLGRPSGLAARERERLLGLGHRLVHSVAVRLDREDGALQRLHDRLPQALARERQRQRLRLEHLEARLALLDPRLVLQRGYAWLTDESGQPVTRAAQTRPGQSLEAVLADGQIGLTVRPAGR
jgi:exodeoxyribonuclease VII large subunit